MRGVGVDQLIPLKKESGMARTHIPVTKICMECGKNLYGYRPVNKTQVENVEGKIIGKTYKVKGLPVGYAHTTCLDNKVKT